MYNFSVVALKLYTAAVAACLKSRLPTFAEKTDRVSLGPDFGSGHDPLALILAGASDDVDYFWYSSLLVAS